MAKYTLEVSRPFSQDGKVDLVPIVSWGKQAEQDSKLFHKGSLALVEGRIQVRSFEDKSGEKVWVTEVVSNFTSTFEGGLVAGTSTAVVDDDIEDDIPF